MKRIKFLVLFLYCFVIILGGCNTKKSEQVSQKPEITTQVAAEQKQESVSQTGQNPVPASKQPETYEEWLKMTIAHEIGAESNLDLPRIANISFDEGEFKPVLSLVADDNLTLNLVRVGMLSDATDVFKAIFADNRAKKASIVWGRPVTDAYGNTKMSAVMAIELSREKANKINWSAFTYSNLPTVADNFFEAPESKW